MRLNKYLALHTDLSRRKADEAISGGRVTVNGQKATLGVDIDGSTVVALDGKTIKAAPATTSTLLVNKPVGYVSSKDGQGSQTVYDLLPEKYHSLNIAGRLDKDSSGLMILTNDGQLLNELTHPSNNKQKIYQVTTNKAISTDDLYELSTGVDIGDERPSKMGIKPLNDATYEVTLTEGRNRQIRRTLSALGYKTKTLQRTQIGGYHIDDLNEKVYNIF